MASGDSGKLIGELASVDNWKLIEELASVEIELIVCERAVEKIGMELYPYGLENDLST